MQDAFVRANSIASWQTPEALRKGLESDRRVYAELLPAIGIK